MLGLKEKDFVELTKSEFLSHFNPILERASKTAHITDEDVDEMNLLKIKCIAKPGIYRIQKPQNLQIHGYKRIGNDKQADDLRGEYRY